MTFLKQNWFGWITVILLASLLLQNLYLQTQIEIMQRKLTCLYDLLDKIGNERPGRLNPCDSDSIFK